MAPWVVESWEAGCIGRLCIPVEAPGCDRDERVRVAQERAAKEAAVEQVALLREDVARLQRQNSTLIDTIASRSATAGPAPHWFLGACVNGPRWGGAGVAPGE